MNESINQSIKIHLSAWESIITFQNFIAVWEINISFNAKICRWTMLLLSRLLNLFQKKLQTYKETFTSSWRWQSTIWIPVLRIITWNKENIQVVSVIKFENDTVYVWKSCQQAQWHTEMPQLRLQESISLFFKILVLPLNCQYYIILRRWKMFTKCCTVSA
jgi:hypothetical protein